MGNFSRFILAGGVWGFIVGMTLDFTGLSLPSDPDADLNEPLGWFIGCILGAGWWLVRRPKKELRWDRHSAIWGFVFVGFSVAEIFRVLGLFGQVNKLVVVLVGGVLGGIFGWWFAKKLSTTAAREEEKISE
tara:strand:- start:202 stop:597 length:396 start_codon:yes stop_codon:yes gene_type:complete